jgi:hypothetical protein
VNRYLQPRQDANIDPTDIRNMQKSISDERHLQADRVHVRRDHDGGAWFLSRAFFEAMQRAHAAQADLIDQHAPSLFDQARNRSLKT